MRHSHADHAWQAKVLARWCRVHQDTLERILRDDPALFLALALAWRRHHPVEPSSNPLQLREAA